MAEEIVVKLPKTLVTRENVERLQCLLDSWTGLRDRDRTHIEILAQKLDSVEVVPTDKKDPARRSHNELTSLGEGSGRHPREYLHVGISAERERLEGKGVGALSELPSWDTAPALRSTGKFRVAESGGESEKTFTSPRQPRKTELDAALVNRDSYGPAA
jgi:hypothetical protein